jgi:Right handed beta helix region
MQQNTRNGNYVQRLSSLVFAILLFGGFAGSARQNQSDTQWDVIVTSRAQLLAALNAGKGKRVGLGSGDYGDLNLSKLPPDMWIGAADASSRPRMSAVSVTDTERLTLENLVVEPSQPPSSRYQSIINIERSQGLRVIGLNVNGWIAPAVAELRGLSIQDSANVTVADCSFTGLHRAIVALRTKGLVFEHNAVNEMSSDGYNLAEVQDVVIVRNSFGAFKTTPESHADYVQFWSDGTEQPSRNITIAENVMLKRGGDDVQGIFLQFEPRLPAENIVVRDNIIVQGSPHGISLYNVNGAQLERNLVLSVAEANYKVAIRVIESSNVMVIDNAAMAVAAVNSRNVTLRRNLELSFENKKARQLIERRILELLEGSGGILPVGIRLAVSDAHRSAGPRPPGHRD